MVNPTVKDELAKDKGYYKGYYFDRDGNLHLTKVDYNKSTNQDNKAFPVKDNK